MLRFIFCALVFWTSSATAFAGEVAPVPLPLAGVTGPVGLAIAGMVYVGYRVYRHFLLKR
jgi:hypothetical protein